MTNSISPHARELLKLIQDQLLSWKDGAERRIDEIHQELVMAYPELANMAADLVAKRPLAFALLDEAFKEGRWVSRKSWGQLEDEAKHLAVPGLFNKMEIKRDQGKTKREHAAFEKKLASSGMPLSTVKPLANMATAVHPVASTSLLRNQPASPFLVHNDIRSLAPQKAWTLLLDETGSDFGAPSGGLIGKFAGLLIATQNSGLPPIRAAWHAAAESSYEIDRVFQQILNTPCGVIGLPVSALPKALGMRWLDGMRALIDWVLRLIPLEGPTQIDVVIEARPPYKPGLEPDAVIRDAIAMLARAWPERAALIDLRISTQPKDGHPLLPYVDSVAFTWGSPQPSSKERLKRSGLVNTCLLNFSSADLAACWDAWDQPGGLTPPYWVSLVTSSEATEPASIASAILSTSAAATRKDSVRWQRYLAEAQRHLFGGSFKLEQIGAMVNWLERAKPPAEEIPNTLRMVWLTVNLAHANHLGATEHEWLTDLTRLSASLYEEVAPLCCHADLHLAVAMTNRFDFEGAQQAIAPWHDRPIAIPGLRYWGQCSSTMGQHRAFTGDLIGAQKAFSEALNAFSRLSDPVVRVKEIDQTSCYAAITAMDNENLSNADARLVLETYLGDLTTAVKQLAGSDSSDHYRHHTLLRWIVSRNDNVLGEQYLGLRDSWSSGYGHPWPLIEIYRAILIRSKDPEGSIEHARTAAAIAFTAQQGPTVQLIGACCRVIGTVWGDPWPEKNSVFSELRQSLPSANVHIDRLEAFLTEPKPAMDILKNVLPFNFH
jgi:hypothetical protein